MSITIKAIFLILSLCFSTQMIAQSSKQLYAYQLLKSNGLSANEVFDILQSKNGLIWMATEEGLIRYDGIRFKTFRNQQQIYPPGSSLREDVYGRIWYQNFDGHLFYCTSDSLHWFQNDKIFNYNNTTVNTQYLFQLQSQNVDIYDIKSLQLVHQISFENQLILSSGSAANESSFYIFSATMLYKIDSLGKLSISKNIQADNFQIRNVIPAGDYLLLINGNSKGKKYEWLDTNLNPVYFNIAIDSLNINAFEYLNGNYWILTENGAYQFDAKGKFLHNYFPQSRISKIIQDLQGNYWFTTIDDGIFIVSSFENILYPTLYNEFKTIHSYKGTNILIDKSGKIFKYDLHNPQQFQLIHDAKSSIYYSFIDPTHHLLYFSVTGLGSTILNLKTNQKSYYNLAIKSVCTINEYYNAIASNGFIGIQQFPNIHSQKSWVDLIPAENFSNYDSSIKMIYGDNVRGRTICYDTTIDQLYFSGNTGTFEINKNRFTAVTQNKENVYAKNLIAANGYLYVFNTAGKLSMRDNNGQWTDLSTTLDIHNEHIWMEKDSEHYIHFITNENIYQLNKQNQELEILNININTSKINDFIVQNDSLILLTAQGIIVKNLKQPENTHHYTARLHINRVSINNNKTDYSSTITIPSSFSKLTIDYSIPDFSNNNKPKLSFRIDNRNWTVLNHEMGILEIHELPEGVHSISFKIGDDIQSQILQIKVLTPIWKQWWFVITLFLCIIWISYYLYKKRVKKLNQQISLLQAKVKLEQELGRSIVKSVKAQMNPHFFYNALNTIQAYIYINDKHNAGLYLNKFSKLTRIILEMTEKDAITLKEEIEALELYLELEKMRFSDNLSFQFEVDKNIDLDFVKIPPMLIQPYVENAVKHGLLHKKEGKKILKISFNLLPKHLEIIVADNGVGRKRSEALQMNKNKKHQSFATAANNNRIDAVNNMLKEKISLKIIDLHNNYNEPSGTEVILHIPLNIEQL